MASKYKVYLTVEENGKKIRKQFYGKTKKDAEKKRDDYLLQQDLKDKKIFIDTFKNWLFDIVKNRVRISSFDKYEGLYRNYILQSPFSFIPVADIRPIDIQKYYNSLFTLGKSSNSIKNANKLLKQFFNYCVDNYYIKDNPVAGKRIYIPIEDYSKKEVEIFTDDEIRKIISSEEEHYIKYAAIISYSTGMRRGEILALRGDDINYTNNTITINKTVVTAYKVDNKGHRHKSTYISIPKTKSSIRTIPLPVGLIKFLSDFYSDQDYLFLSKQGNFIDASNFEKSWYSFLKRCGIKHKKFHALRHTYATKQFENGIPALTVSKLLGHSSIEITLNTYTHVSEENKSKSIDTLSIL